MVGTVCGCTTGPSHAGGGNGQPAGAHFLGFIAAIEDLGFKQIADDIAGLDFLHPFDLLVGHIQGMAEMGIGIGLVALLLGDARDIGLIETFQPGQAEAVKADTGQDKTTRPQKVRHCVSP